MGVVDASFGNTMKLEEEATIPLAGGILSYGYQCGMLWGAALAAGAQAYHRFGAGAQAESMAIVATQRLVESFKTHTKNEMNCTEITQLNMHGKIEPLPVLKFILTGKAIGCFRMAGNYAPEVFRDINLAFSENLVETPSRPVSCASMLLEKMGASEMHAVMAAGLAGGIGLTGGTCGALGAAIWVKEMRVRKAAVGNKPVDSQINETIEKFLNSSDYEFECAKIVGRKFETIAEHAGYMQAGGCAKIIETLAAV